MRTVTVSHNWYSFPQCSGTAILTVFSALSNISHWDWGRIHWAWSGVRMKWELGHSLTTSQDRFWAPKHNNSSNIHLSNPPPSFTPPKRPWFSQEIHFLDSPFFYDSNNPTYVWIHPLEEEVQSLPPFCLLILFPIQIWCRQENHILPGPPLYHSFRAPDITLSLIYFLDIFGPRNP